MNSTLCSSLSEISSSCFESFQIKTINLLVSKPFIFHGNFSKKGKFQAVHANARKLAITNHLVPGHLEGSYMGKKHLKEPSQKLKCVRTLLIDNYDSYTYNIYQELSITNGLPPVVVRNDEWTWEEVCRYLYEEKAFDNIVISPGPGSPACPSDIGICLKLLLECKDIPILGICLGHQALGYVHGAQVVHAAQPIHGRLSEIQHSGCRLFHGIPCGKHSGFKVVRYHSLVIDATSLPKELVPIAWTSSNNTLPFLGNQKSNVIDAHGNQLSEQNVDDSFSSKLKDRCHLPANDAEGMWSENVLMGIRHSTRPHYGVQFHPESVATCHGRQIFKNFTEITEDYWFRLNSSSTSDMTARYAACMQVPDASCLFKDVTRTVLDNNNIDGISHLSNSNDAKLPDSSNSNKFLKLKWRKCEKLASKVGGTRNIFCKLYGGHQAENTFWLDSSSLEKRRARFSFMGGKGGSLWKQFTFRLSDRSGLTSKGGGYLLIEDSQGITRSTYLEDGFLDFLSKELNSFCYDEKDYEGLPFDFYGGFVGYIGYGLKVECGMPSNRHNSDAPDACFFFSDNLIVIDHLYDDVYIMSVDDRSGRSQWLDDTEQKILSLKVAGGKNLISETSGTVANTTFKAGFIGEKSREQYIGDVEKCLKFIKDGESYELCLTTQMRKKIGKIDLLRLYLNLREKNPAPYAAWFNFSKEKISICCSSPERFLRLDKNGILEAKPIKGTIARGLTPEEDEQLKLKLQYSEKDQAENLMIVDLLRNDLGRVCEPGSVHVPHLMTVESYATVHTMVSTIRGKKRPDIGAVACVRAAFPGGSMTGAPKLRSMELLDSLESSSRGIYSGSIGFFSYNQTFDLNIVIRTVVIHEGEASIGAGGAIVALSKPEDEYEEMILKTLAPAMAVMELEVSTSSDK